MEKLNMSGSIRSTKQLGGSVPDLSGVGTGIPGSTNLNNSFSEVVSSFFQCPLSTIDLIDFPAKQRPGKQMSHTAVGSPAGAPSAASGEPSAVGRRKSEQKRIFAQSEIGRDFKAAGFLHAPIQSEHMETTFAKLLTYLPAGADAVGESVPAAA
jgi:hypothetical protein